MLVNTRFDLLAMAALLEQGRHLRVLSLGLMTLAAGWLILAATLAPDPLDPAVAGALALSLLAGLAQTYFAGRVDFDARLLRGLSTHADKEDPATVLDASLEALGLLEPGKGGRKWSVRWRGMRRLLRRQAACLAVQSLLMVSAWLAAAGTWA